MKCKLLVGTTLLSFVLSTTFAQSASDAKKTSDAHKSADAKGTSDPQEAAVLDKQKMIDSLRSAGLDEYAIRYPMLRQGMFATDFIGKGRVKSELNGQPLKEGEAAMHRIRSNFKLPLSQWGKNAITATVTYQQQRYEANSVTEYDPQNTAAEHFTLDKATVGLSATYTRADSLFNRPVFFSGTVTGVTDELSSIKRLNYTFGVTLPIKRTPVTALTLGFVVIVDPSSVAPFIPVFSYWHKFKSADLELFADVPSRVIVRKQLSKKSWATLGSELGGNLMFFDLNQPSLPQDVAYSTLEIRSGGTFEYQVSKKIILGVNGGLYTTSSSRMFDRRDKPTDYFLKTQTGTVPYISLSVSILPFLKRL